MAENLITAQSTGLLPHEAAFVRMALGVAKDSQTKAELAYSEAVGNSGGDWAFDDEASKAAAEVAHGKENDVKTLTGLLKLMHNHGLLSYPDADSVSISIGTRVKVRMGGYDDTYDITSHHIPGMETQPPDEDIMPVSPTSPMGAALLGARPGDSVTWQSADRRTFAAEVIQVDQQAQAASYAYDT